jgi:hypothetical protein
MRTRCGEVDDNTPPGVITYTITHEADGRVTVYAENTGGQLAYTTTRYLHVQYADGRTIDFELTPSTTDLCPGEKMRNRFGEAPEDAVLTII